MNSKKQRQTSVIDFFKANTKKARIEHDHPDPDNDDRQGTGNVAQNNTSSCSCVDVNK